jgi:glycosyltransferase involved in cell wall biosynthesis
VRICLVFDCLYPHSVGGAERWYRALADEVSARGHEVTYLTLPAWQPESGPEIPGVDVVAVAPNMELFVRGRRSIGAQLRFALGVFRHLVRHGGRYDVVQTPGLHLSLLAVVAARKLRRFAVVVDWFEVWRRQYWLEYLGPVWGRLGWLGQRVGARSRHAALCFSRMHAERLRALGHTGAITIVEGLRSFDDLEAGEPAPAEPVVVFAGRQIPEKRVLAIVPAVALARERVPELRAEIFGDGPERAEVLRLIREHGLADAVEAPGFADGDRVRESVRHALCLLQPSVREGYGIVVVEASALGTPTVVVDAPDNAAAELVDSGENGFVAPSAEPRDLADAILAVHDAGQALRDSTRAWFRRNRERLSLENSIDTVVGLYGRARDL